MYDIEAGCLRAAARTFCKFTLRSPPVASATACYSHRLIRVMRENRASSPLKVRVRYIFAPSVRESVILRIDKLQFLRLVRLPAPSLYSQTAYEPETYVSC